MLMFNRKMYEKIFKKQMWSVLYSLFKLKDINFTKSRGSLAKLRKSAVMITQRKRSQNWLLLNDLSLKICTPFSVAYHTIYGKIQLKDLFVTSIQYKICVTLDWPGDWPLGGPSLLRVMVPCLMGITGGLEMVMVDDTEGGAQVEASGLDTDSRDTVIASS